tara:strand:+ start:995 stop:1474 length:480 start_codon:yes stop_codon:yes gene_type:complete
MNNEIEFNSSQSFYPRLFGAIGQRLLIVLIIGLVLGFFGAKYWMFIIVLPILAFALILKAIPDTKWNIEHLFITKGCIRIRATCYSKIILNKNINLQDFEVNLDTTSTGRGPVHKLIVSINGYPRINQLTDKYWTKDKFDQILEISSILQDENREIKDL